MKQKKNSDSSIKKFDVEFLISYHKNSLTRIY